MKAIKIVPENSSQQHLDKIEQKITRLKSSNLQIFFSLPQDIIRIVDNVGHDAQMGRERPKSLEQIFPTELTSSSKFAIHYDDLSAIILHMFSTREYTEQARVAIINIIGPIIYSGTKISYTPDVIFNNEGKAHSPLSQAIANGQVNELEIWSSKSITSADIGIIKTAFQLGCLSYSEFVELGDFSLLDNKTAIHLIKQKIPITFRNLYSDKLTIVSTKGDDNGDIKAVVSSEISIVDVRGIGMYGVPGIAARIFTALAKEKINVRIIVQASSEHSITIGLNDCDSSVAHQCLETEFNAELKYCLIHKIELIPDLAMISVVGDKMAQQPGVAAKITAALAKAHINIINIAQGQTERNITLVVKKSDGNGAVRAIHRACIEKIQPRGAGIYDETY